jgi:purine-binding chemotaxis protein CheW
MSGSATLAPPSAGSTNGAGIEHQLDYANQYVSFWLDEQLLGVPVNLVQEVLNPQKIAKTPRARGEIAGLLNLRGQIVTAVNLRERMGLRALPSDRESMNVVVRHNNESFSLLVDEVGDVININGETLQPVPHTSIATAPVTTGVFRLEKRLFIILHVAAVLKLS